MKKLLLTIAILVPFFTMAQTPNDIIDFSTIYYQGTAKSAAMGNAMGAVGSDFSAIAINPAGLGLFRKSYFVYTPQFSFITTDTKYQGSNGYGWTFKVPTNNIGLSWTQEYNNSSLKSVSFALGVNSLNNYSHDISVNGFNPNTSLTDAYLNELDANGINTVAQLEDYSPNGIYSLYLTDILVYNDATHMFGTTTPLGNLHQKQSAKTSGYSREFTFATGFNINDKWFLGVSINIPYFDKKATYDYKEQSQGNTALRKWYQTEYMYDSGKGINAALGAIVYPLKWLRVGASFQTPTLYKIEENWHTETAAFFNSGNLSDVSPVSSYTYSLITPYRANASLAFIFGNYGMITADYDFIDYRMMRVSSYDYSYDNLNDYIKETFNSTSNIRVGTEWRWHKCSYRAGYAFYGSPFGFDKSQLTTNSYSIGWGFTHRGFTLDLAYVLSQRRNNYELYSLYSSYPAYYEDSDNNLVADDTKVKETTNTHQVVISFKLKLD